MFRWLAGLVGVVLVLSLVASGRVPFGALPGWLLFAWLLWRGGPGVVQDVRRVFRRAAGLRVGRLAVHRSRGEVL